MANAYRLELGDKLCMDRRGVPGKGDVACPRDIVHTVQGIIDGGTKVKVEVSQGSFDET